MLTILKASAGSGKTYSLVTEYLCLALPNISKFNSIIAITFTNASAADMRAKIIARLKDLINLDETVLTKESYYSQIISVVEGNLLELKKRATDLLANIENNYHKFNVLTIDSFLSGLVRTLAKELGIKPEFTITEDVSDARAQIVNQFWSSLYLDEQVFELMKQYIKELIHNQKSWNFRGGLSNDAKLIFETSTPISHKTFEDILEIIEVIKTEKENIDNLLKQTVNSVIKQIEASNTFDITEFNRNNNPLDKIVRLLKEGKINVLEDGYPACINQGIFKPEQVYKKASSAAFIDFVEGELGNIMQKILDFSTHNTQHFNSINAVWDKLYHTSVFIHLHNLLDEYREKKNTLFISDFPKKLRAFLTEENTAFLFAKLGDAYEHFLIDEFQDTSIDQWEVLYPMVSEVIAKGNKSLIVGDAKQSIYRWRGGEVKLMEEIIPKQFYGNVVEKSLENNFRSTPEVVDFNNRFFLKITDSFISSNSDNKELVRVYKGLEQKVVKPNKSGFVPKIISIDERRKEDRMVIQSVKIVDEIIRLKVDEGVSLKDMAILVRNNNDANATIQILLEKEIEFISYSSLYVEYDSEVKVLLSSLKYLTNSKDNVSFFEVIYFLDKLNKGINEANILATLDENLLSQHITEVCGYLIEQFKLNLNENEYLKKFMEVVLDFLQKEDNHSIYNFITTFFKHQKYSVIPSEKTEGVRILSIHKSKGLEFNTVFLPSVDWQFTNSFLPEKIWVQSTNPPFKEFDYYLVNIRKKLKDSYFSSYYKDYQNKTVMDNLNLMYVAFTRAKERLYIYTSNIKEPKDVESINSANQLIAMGQDLFTS